jgi:tRNA pseudouridine13 synthase
MSGGGAYREERRDALSAAEFLEVPAAFGGSAGRAVLREQPEDFQVREWLGFEADGEGDHVLLRVRKRSANTFWVAKQLARMAQIHPRDVGYAGLKDRDAIAEQAFTVPLRSAVGLNWNGLSGDGFEVIDAQRHRRKLKRGALRGNAFEIVLREFDGDAGLLERRLTEIAARGAPNYFGSQRFGRSGQNIKTALQWFESGQGPADRLQRGFAISAARSALFNLVLVQRVQDQTWNRLIPGDLANLDGSGSIFAVDVPDATLIERCDTLDIHPSGPLWHGVSAASADAKRLEQNVASRYLTLSEGLARIAPEPERRALRMRVSDLQWQIEGNVVRLSFRLGKGSFATAVLHELIDNAFVTDIPEGE